MDVSIAGTALTQPLDDEEFSRVNIELAAFDGEVGIGQFPVPDPSGAAIVASGRQLLVREGAVVVSAGFIIDQDWRRGPLPRLSNQREYNYSVMDANALLGGFRVTRTRPSETDYARVMAFAGLDGPAWDTTWVLNASTVTMPTKKYDGDGGWSELITDLVEFTGKTLFLHDKAGGGRCLHYHLLTNGHTCGLSISDVLADLNATTFAPIGPMRLRTSVDLANDVKGRDQAGRTHTSTDATSITAHDADGLQHQALIDFEAASQTDLNVKTAAWLASSKDERDTYTCAIGPLTETELGLIRVGDLMSVTSGAMGLSASTQRIAHMALSVYNNTPGTWLATLELGAPIRRRARVKPSRNPPTDTTVDGSTLIGADLGTEDWSDAEDQVYLSHVFDAGGEVAFETFFAGEVQPLAGNIHDTVAPDATIARSYISHDAPAGAANARLRCEIIAERAEDAMEQTTTFAIRRGTWGATFPPSFGSFSDVLHSGTILAQWTAAMGGAEPYVRYAIDCWIPIQDGRAQFVLESGTDATFEGSPYQNHRAFLVATGADPSVDVAYYALTFYGLHTAGMIGSVVSPTPVGTGDGYSTSFRTPYPYVPGSLSVTVNGVQQEVIETDPSTGQFDLAYAPASGPVRAAFTIADTTETGVPIPETGAELGPTVPFGADIQDVGTANAPGDNATVARDDHVHEGVHSIKKTGSAELHGDVTLSAGTNVTLTQAGQDIAISASGGGGGATAWVDFSTDGVTLDTGRIYVYDASQDAYILMDGVIALTAGSGYGIELAPDTNQVVEITSGAGLRFRNLGSDPTSAGDGHVYYHSTADMLRLRQNGSWVYIPWQGPSGTATIASGNTSVTVTHGAGFDPISARGVSVWPTNNPTNDPGWFWVSNVGATTFDINVRANPGASGAIFAWRIVPT